MRDIKAGETVLFKFDYLYGHGRYHGAITYERAGQGSDALLLSRNGDLRVGNVASVCPDHRAPEPRRPGTVRLPALLSGHQPPSG